MCRRIFMWQISEANAHTPDSTMKGRRIVGNYKKRRIFSVDACLIINLRMPFKFNTMAFFRGYKDEGICRNKSVP